MLIHAIQMVSRLEYYLVLASLEENGIPYTVQYEEGGQIIMTERIAFIWCFIKKG